MSNVVWFYACVSTHIVPSRPTRLGAAYRAKGEGDREREREREREIERGRVERERER